MMLIIKHSILPVNPRTETQRSSRFFRLELVPIVGILQKKLHVPIYMHVNDYWSIIHNVVM